MQHRLLSRRLRCKVLTPEVICTAKNGKRIPTWRTVDPNQLTRKPYLHNQPLTLRTDPRGGGLRTVSADEFKDLVNKNDLGSGMYGHDKGVLTANAEANVRATVQLYSTSEWKRMPHVT